VLHAIEDRHNHGLWTDRRREVPAVMRLEFGAAQSPGN
jgi:hypothetical protein